MRRASVIVCLVLAAAFTLVLGGCGRSSPDTAAPDARKTTPEGERRIVALSPALAHMLVGLGLEDRIVGRHDWDLVLSKQVPAVGSQDGIDYEALLRTDPTDVLLEWGSRPLPTRLTTLADEHGWTIRNYGALLTLDDIATTLDDLHFAYARADDKPDEASANPIPWAPTVWLKMAVLMPMSSPRALISAPPEFPGLIAASVWMKFSKGIEADAVAAGGADDAHGNRLADVQRIADCEHHVADANAGHLGDADAGRARSAVFAVWRYRFHDLHRSALRLAAAPVGQRDQDFVGAVDHVLIGQNVALGADDDAGAEIGFAVAALAAL